MSKKLLARLVMDSGSYLLLLADGTIRSLDKEEVRNFILSFNCPEHYTSCEPSGIESDAMPLAEIDANGNLVFSDPTLLLNVFQKEVRYISAIEFGNRYGKGKGIIYRFCREGRIPGAILKDRRWWIPEGTPYPELEKKGRKAEPSSR